MAPIPPRLNKKDKNSAQLEKEINLLKLTNKELAESIKKSSKKATNQSIEWVQEQDYATVNYVSFGSAGTDYIPITIGSTTKNVLTDHQSLSGYATESWVTDKGYITSSGSCAYATSAGSVEWDNVSNKPSTYPPSEHSHSWSSITGKPTSKTAWGNTYCDSNGDFQSISGSLSSVANISFDQSGRNIGSLLYFDTNNGRVGVGTSSPSYKLHVSGSIYATGAITERSDIRCKDVETYQWAPSLSMIANAPIIRYSMKDDDTHRMRVGSVAQYWKKMIPETVSESADGTLSIAQGDICMVGMIALAREIKQLKAEIKLLRNGRS